MSSIIYLQNVYNKVSLKTINYGENTLENQLIPQGDYDYSMENEAVSPNEEISKNYILQYKNNYAPEVLMDGLMNHGISKSETKTYLEKYGSSNFSEIKHNKKGLKDFFKLRTLLDDNTIIVLIGLSKKQLSNLPDGILGIPRTESVEELVMWYSASDIFINPTYQDNFPTTNIESLACGTPVITYNTGGSPEAVDDKKGRVVEKGNAKGLFEAIKKIEALNRETLAKNCRERALNKFNKNDRYQDYINLFEDLINNID